MPHSRIFSPHCYVQGPIQPASTLHPDPSCPTGHPDPHNPCMEPLRLMSAFFTPLSHCYVLFCCEIQSRYPGFTPRLPVCSPTALRMANGNPRKTYSHRRPRETAKRKREELIGWPGWLILDESARCWPKVECEIVTQSTIRFVFHLPPFLLSLPLPHVRLEIESILNWIFRLPFPPNRMQSNNSSFSHTPRNLLS